jgi:hypothetical protein
MGVPPFFKVKKTNSVKLFTRLVPQTINFGRLVESTELGVQETAFLALEESESLLLQSSEQHVC